MFVFGDGIAAFFLFLLVVCGLGHRQISPSLSSLHVRTLLSRIAPLSLYHVQRGYKRQRSARYELNAGVAHAGCSFLSIRFVQIASEHKESGIAAAFCCYFLRCFSTW